MTMRRYSESSTLSSQIADRFPAELWLDDGGSVTITPMVASDWQLVEKFVTSLSKNDCQTLEQDGLVNDRVLYWCSRMNYEHVLPVLAWDNDCVIGYSILERRPNAWDGNAGKLYVIVRPDYR